jgi:hypothetical protein
MVLHEGGRVRMWTSDRVRGEGFICWASEIFSDGIILWGGIGMWVRMRNDVGNAGSKVLFVNVSV